MPKTITDFLQENLAMQHHIFTNHLFSALFENVNIGILVAGEDGLIEYANKYLLSEFGYDKPDLLHQAVEILVPGPLRQQHAKERAAFSQAPASITVNTERNLRGVKKDGTEFPVELALGYCRDGKNVCHIAFVNDIRKNEEAEETIKRLTAELDQKVKERTRSLNATVEELSRQIRENERKDEELQKALEKEQELSALKSRFVSAASHEFRTPLSGVLASTYLLSKYTKEDEQPQRDRHIKRIISSVNLLNEILGDFLSVEKIEHGDFRPAFSNFDIEALADEIIQSVQCRQKPGQNITLACSGDGKMVVSDRSMLQHILTNLLSNAIKYSPENSESTVSIDCSDGKLVISVRDQGIGIPADEQANLFTRFFRASNAAHIEGTGLGLNIVKRYVESLNGNIACKSELNKGTEFTITLNQTLCDENNTDSRGQ